MPDKKQKEPTGPQWVEWAKTLEGQSVMFGCRVEQGKRAVLPSALAKIAVARGLAKAADPPPDAKPKKRKQEVSDGLG